MPRLPVICCLTAFLIACASIGAHAHKGDTASPQPAPPLTWHGEACTKDCSGHKAGYAWAQKKGITDVKDCHAKAKSFNEGCKLWVKDQQAKAASSSPSGK